jgi:organic radical activating enzyme
VVTKELHIGVINKLREEFPEKTPLLLQPRSNSRRSGERALRLLGQSLKEGLKNVQVTAQIHKIFGWR